MIEYNRSNIILAQNLRKNMTEAEKKLWFCFLRHYPVRFQRQKAIGDYIVDFYCAAAHLAIELDGDWHYYEEQMEKDEDRASKLTGYGVSILRFTNHLVFYEFDVVCKNIDNAIRDRLLL